MLAVCTPSKKKEKMAEIILRQEAIDDLNNIWEYTFEK